MKHIQVVAAIVTHNDKILCVQRGQNEYEYISLKYEFSGGKVKPNENDEEAIKREVKEELLHKRNMIKLSVIYWVNPKAIGKLIDRKLKH
jgi:8-oxo-dGTP pyrophosphatase MutT (NUDIX family)